VVNPREAKRIVERVQKGIEASKDTPIWPHYINSLNLISQVVFVRASGFVLELIQNAEDAGLGLDEPGVFEIRLNKYRMKVTHNGRPFSENDVKDLCGIGSSKKPEKGMLGYLGIGFKSVFKVTDCPEIYSGGFQFKFDRSYWKNPIKTPWHVLPIWIDRPSETIDCDETTFIIPYREEAYYPGLLEEVRKLKTELYLFLRWLKTISIVDEVSEVSWVLENMGENEEGITALKHDGQQQKFKFFRRVCQVPDWVKHDRLTQQYRVNVTQREIAIAFALDHEGNLSPWEAGAMYGGVYSFLPLGEAKSGAKFPIQADFLVQPGREEINFEARWNHWLLEEVTELCKEAVDCFKKHDTWKYQFLPAFEFTKYAKVECYEKLFRPKLVEPLENFIQTDDCTPTAGEGWAKPKEVVKLSEDIEASKDLVAMGILKEDEIAPLLGGQPGLKLVHPNVKEPLSVPFKKVSRSDLLANESFLEHKAKESSAPDWFRNLYLWLAKYPSYYKSGKSKYVERYHDVKLVLSSTGEILTGGKVWLPDITPPDPMLKDLTETLQKSKPMLHPGILGNVKNEEEKKEVRGFLMGFTGVQALDSKTVCKEALLPRILTSASQPTPNELLKYAIYCQQILEGDVESGLEFWVLTKQGDVRAAKETLLPKELKPTEDWETNRKYVPGISFVSTSYLVDGTADEELETWRQFFYAGGVNEKPNNGVEVFAENWAKEKLESVYKNVIHVDKLKFGYDMEAETQTGEKIRIEVKGQSHEQDVELKDNELDAADMYKDSFYLCVVSSIPETPTMHLVKNPATPGVGKKDKLTIPVNIWKQAKWP